MKVVGCLGLVAGFLLVPAAHQDAKKDLERLQGAWVMESLEIDGEQVPAEKLAGTTLTMSGNKYIVTVKGKMHETVITLDPAKKPKAIDMVFAEGPNKDKVHRGIYDLQGDTFKICRGQGPEAERPTEFATEASSGKFIVVWKRAPK
jgi:uncharacterized protein (TIGR03067 family)